MTSNTNYYRVGAVLNLYVTLLGGSPVEYFWPARRGKLKFPEGWITLRMPGMIPCLGATHLQQKVDDMYLGCRAKGLGLED